MTDLSLAIAHHLTMFALLWVLAYELVAVRPDMDQGRVVALANVDRAYGALSGLMLLIGFARVTMAAKGWDYYAHNGFFWAKMAAFALVGALSIAPSIQFVKWRRGGQAPDPAQVARVRTFLYAQTMLFALLPLFAAAMARGYGTF